MAARAHFGFAPGKTGVCGELMTHKYYLRSIASCLQLRRMPYADHRRRALLNGLAKGAFSLKAIDGLLEYQTDKTNRHNAT